MTSYPIGGLGATLGQGVSGALSSLQGLDQLAQYQYQRRLEAMLIQQSPMVTVSAGEPVYWTGESNTLNPAPTEPKTLRTELQQETDNWLRDVA